MSLAKPFGDWKIGPMQIHRGVLASLLGLLFLVSFTACATNGPPLQTRPAVPLTAEQRHALEQKRIEIEQEIFAIESSPDVQRLMGGRSTIEEATISLADQESYNLPRYYSLRAMLQRIDILLQ